MLRGIRDATILATIVTIATLGLISFVARPMARNYAECGTIFLCANQPKS